MNDLSDQNTELCKDQLPEGWHWMDLVGLTIILLLSFEAAIAYTDAGQQIPEVL